jgi:hypothetical protein
MKIRRGRGLDWGGLNDGNAVGGFKILQTVRTRTTDREEWMDIAMWIITDLAR